jgi:putative polyhydroxyalkanoate system protein
MSHINIHRKHDLSHEKARESAESIAKYLDDKFSLSYRWEGSSLHFERSGVSGYIEIEEKDVWVNVRLGFLLLPLRSRFEQEIHRYMDELFEENQKREV